MRNGVGKASTNLISGYLTLEQLSQMTSYCTILAVAFLGALDGPWYLLIVGAAALAVIAIHSQRQYRPRFAEAEMAAVFETAAHASAAHAVVASLAAYGLGAAARLVFL